MMHVVLQCNCVIVVLCQMVGHGDSNLVAVVRHGLLCRLFPVMSGLTHWAGCTPTAPLCVVMRFHLMPAVRGVAGY